MQTSSRHPDKCADVRLSQHYHAAGLAHSGCFETEDIQAGADAAPTVVGAVPRDGLVAAARRFRQECAHETTRDVVNLQAGWLPPPMDR